MLKLRTVIILFSIILLLCSCSLNNDAYTYYKNGIEEFYIYEGHVELNLYILPSDDFLDSFAYIDAEYYFKEKSQSSIGIAATETSLLLVQYSPDVYELAKEYCLQEMVLNEDVVIEHGDYVFIENVKLAIGQDRFNENYKNAFPDHFNMLAFNDNSKCLAFIGFYNGDYSSNSEKENQTIANDWGSFIDEHFCQLHGHVDDSVASATFNDATGTDVTDDDPITKVLKLFIKVIGAE